jgi:hypothetical protein
MMRDNYESTSKMETNINTVLQRLKDRSEEGLAKLVYTGKALSKSDTHLHLAVSSGIVLIPIAEIDSIAYVYKDFNEDYLHVTVKNADRVRHALRREQLRDSGGSGAAASSAGADQAFHFEHSTVTSTTENFYNADACVRRMSNLCHKHSGRSYFSP